MRKFKLDKNISIRISSLAMAGMLFVTGFVLTGCSEKKQNNSAIVQVQNQNDETQKGLKSLFPTINDEIIENASLIILLDEIAKEDENGKINADVISNFKTKLDVDNMIDDFNSVLNVLEQSMIEEQELIVTSDLVIENDEEILSKVEKITDAIIIGDVNTKKSNFDLIYTLFVEEDEITYDDLTFEIRDLSYAGRALAATYARTSAYFARNYITKEEYNKIDDRTNDQNNKAYIKTDLEVLSNQIVEESKIDVEFAFENENNETTAITTNKVDVSNKNIKNLINLINLEYLTSDEVSTKDKNNILGEYSDEIVSNTLLTVDALTKYNASNNSDIVLFSDILIDKYKETTKGKVDKVALDYIQFNSIKLLNTTTNESTSSEIFNNPYFQNIYLYLRKANFTHKYSKDNQVDVNYQDISDGAKVIMNEVVYYTLNQRSNVFEYEGYKEKTELNLKESIQYIQNTMTGECEKVELDEYVKVK